MVIITVVVGILDHHGTIDSCECRDQHHCPLQACSGTTHLHPTSGHHSTTAEDWVAPSEPTSVALVEAWGAVVA